MTKQIIAGPVMPAEKTTTASAPRGIELIERLLSTGERHNASGTERA